MSNALEITELSFSYQKDEVIKNLSLIIEKGKYITIIGHNGSGKSTLAKLIIGLLEAKKGTIKVFDEILTEETVSHIRDRVGIIFQNPDNQFIGATVKDDIAFGLENHLVPHEDMEDIIQDFAKKVNMSEFLDKEPSNLSGGQKQRVAIAGVLAMHPDIIIMDEATAMLDPKGRREIRELTLEMRKSNSDLTIISITHDIEEAFHADQVIVLNKGEIVYQDEPQKVFEHYNELREMNLDIPFVYSLKEELKKLDVEVTDSLDEEEVIDSLCL